MPPVLNLGRFGSVEREENAPAMGPPKPPSLRLIEPPAEKLACGVKAHAILSFACLTVNLPGLNLRHTSSFEPGKVQFLGLKAALIDRRLCYSGLQVATAAIMHSSLQSSSQPSRVESQSYLQF